MNAKLILTAALLTMAMPAQDDAVWPRHLDRQGHKVVVYEPEVAEWRALPDPVEARAIVAVTPNGSTTTYYGEMLVRYETQASRKPGHVLLTTRTIEGMTFPKASDARARYLADVVGVALPAAKPIEADAERLQGAPADRITIKREPLQMQLVFDGPITYRYIGHGVSYVVNTRHDLFRYKHHYYLCEAGVWYVAKTPTGTYEVCAVVPEAIYKIPKDHAKHHVTYVVVHEVHTGVVVVGFRPGYLAIARWAHFHYHRHHHPHYRHIVGRPVLRHAAAKRRVRIQPVPRRVVGRPKVPNVRRTPAKHRPVRTQPVKSRPVRTQPVRTQPVRTQRARGAGGRGGRGRR